MRATTNRGKSKGKDAPHIDQDQVAEATHIAMAQGATHACSEFRTGRNRAPAIPERARHDDGQGGLNPERRNTAKTRPGTSHTHLEAGRKTRKPTLRTAARTKYSRQPKAAISSEASVKSPLERFHEENGVKTNAIYRYKTNRIIGATTGRRGSSRDQPRAASQDETKPSKPQGHHFSVKQGRDRPQEIQNSTFGLAGAGIRH